MRASWTPRSASLPCPCMPLWLQAQQELLLPLQAALATAQSVTAELQAQGQALEVQAAHAQVGARQGTVERPRAGKG